MLRRGPGAIVRAFRSSICADLPLTEAGNTVLRIADAGSGTLAIDLGGREIWRDGELVVLAPHVFDCIAYLLVHRDRAIGRDELVAAVWGRTEVGDAAVHQALMKARRALGDSGEEQRTIRTVPRFGYRWVAAVETATDAGQVAASPIHPVIDDGAPENTPVPATTPHVSAKIGAPRRWLRALTWAAVLVTVVAAVIATRDFTWSPSSPTPTRHGDAIVVLPVTVAAAGDTAWIPLGVMDAIGSYLRDGGEAVVPSQTVIGLLGDAGATDPTLRRWHEATGADRILRARATRMGTGWRVELVLQGNGAVRSAVDGVAADVVEAARLASQALLSRLHPGRVGDGTHAADDIASLLQRARAELLDNRVAVAAAVLDAAPDVARNTAEVRLLRAEVDYRAGRFDAARAAYGNLLGELTVESRPLLRAQALVALASIDRTAARFDEAERGYAQAIALLGPHDDAIALGRAHLYRGASLSSLRRFDEARDEIARGRVLLGGAGDAEGVASADAAMATLEADRGRLAEAAISLARAIDRLERLGEHAKALDMRVALAQMHTELLEHAAALEQSERVWREISEQTGHRLYTMAGAIRARALAAVGRLLDAAQVLDRVEAIAPDRDYQWRYEREVAAQLALRRGDAARTARIAAEVAAGPDIGGRSELGPLLLAWSRADRVAGGSAGDAQLAERVAAWSAGNEPGGADEGIYVALIRAEGLRARGDREGAASEYRLALSRASDFGVPMHLAAVVQSWGNALIGDGMLDEATAVVGRVAGFAATDFDCAVLAARLHRALGNREAWHEAGEHARELAGERQLPPAVATFDAAAPIG